MKMLAYFAVISMLLFAETHALIHNLRVTNDERSRFFIENFGFEAGGHLHMEIKDFKVDGKPYSPGGDKPEVGFLIKRSEDPDLDYVVGIRNARKTVKDIVVQPGQEGFFNTYFVSCLNQPISFNLYLEQYNVKPDGGRSYLSAGRDPLPLLYGVLTGTYFLMMASWIVFFIRGKAPQLVNRVHHLMTLLVLLKMLAMLFKTIDFHVKSTTGSAHGWGVVYYLFAGAKGLLMFVLIALIGTGWKFVKPFLSENDKRIFMIVIPLQLVDNIALILIEEAAPGSQGFFTWKDIFRLVDILCCGAILLPIIWSINHLRDASQIDGKAARNLHKLRLFRLFYVAVVAYIYVTRIIVFLVDATLPFRFVWLGALSSELATVMLYTFSGYLFRPMSENPYFKLLPHELEEIASAPAPSQKDAGGSTATHTTHRTSKDEGTAEPVAEQSPAVLADEVTGDDLEEEESGGENEVQGHASEENGEVQETEAPVQQEAVEPVSLPSSFQTEELPDSDAYVNWQSEHNTFLDQKAQKESEDRERGIEEARTWLDNFYKERDDKKATREKMNREAEDRFISDRDAALTSGEKWERAAFFCDFQIQEGTDIARLRSLMMDLKH